VNRPKSAPQTGARAPSFRRRCDVDGKTALGGASSRQRIAPAQLCVGSVERGAAHRRRLAAVRRTMILKGITRTSFASGVGLALRLRPRGDERPLAVPRRFGRRCPRSQHSLEASAYIRCGGALPDAKPMSQNPRRKTWFCVKPAKPDGRARRAPRSFRTRRASDRLRIGGSPAQLLSPRRAARGLSPTEPCKGGIIRLR
jgi:hypothetical protein